PARPRASVVVDHSRASDVAGARATAVSSASASAAWCWGRRAPIGGVVAPAGGQPSPPGFTSRTDEGRRHGRDDTVRWPACAAGFAFFRSRLSDCVERLPVHAFVKLSQGLTASVEVGPVLVEQHAGALPDDADSGIGAEAMLLP